MSTTEQTTYTALSDAGRGRLGVGDDVVTGFHDGTGLETHTVARTTATQVILDNGERYMVRSGQRRHTGAPGRVRFLLGVPAGDVPASAEAEDTAGDPDTYECDRCDGDSVGHDCPEPDEQTEEAAAGPVKDAITERLEAAAAVVEHARVFVAWAQDNGTEAMQGRAAGDLEAALAEATPTPDEAAARALVQRAGWARRIWERRWASLTEWEDADTPEYLRRSVYSRTTDLTEAAVAGAVLEELEDAATLVTESTKPGSTAQSLHASLTMIRDRHLGNLLNAQLTYLPADRAAKLTAAQEILRILAAHDAL